MLYSDHMACNASINDRLSEDSSCDVDCEILPDGQIRLVFRNELADFIQRESARQGLTPQEFAAQLLVQQVAE